MKTSKIDAIQSTSMELIDTIDAIIFSNVPNETYLLAEALVLLNLLTNALGEEHDQRVKNQLISKN